MRRTYFWASIHSPAKLLRSLVAGVLISLIFTGLLAFPASAQDVAYVRVIHASPYVGAADVFVDGNKLLSSFQFAAVTDYVQVPAGPHKIQIAVVGQGINAAALTQQITVTAGVVYTVAALGTSPSALSLATFIDNNQVAAGMAKVRVYHLSPDAGAPQIAVGEDATVTGVGYSQASQYLTLSPGPCTFNLTTPSFSGKGLSLATTLSANTVTSVFAVGMFNGTPAARLVVAETAGVPGMPGTGNDPQAHAGSSSQPLPFWLVGVLALAVIGTGVFTRRKFIKH